MSSTEYSVLMSVCYRDEPCFFNRALRSLWDDQTVKPAQIVLVEDGPQLPEVREYVSFWQKRLGATLTIVRLDRNRGLAVALNKGLSLCHYELVARMDSDDIAMPYRFERQLAEFSKDSHVGVVGSYAQEICRKGISGRIRRMPVKHETIHQSLYTCPFIHPTVMFKKSIIESLGGYDESLKRRQDYELWFRCAKASVKFANVPEALLMYRFGADTHSRQSIRDVLRQGRIGSKGVRSLEQSYWKRVACYVPAVRSVFPQALQHILYRGMRRFDPRQR